MELSVSLRAGLAWVWFGLGLSNLSLTLGLLEAVPSCPPPNRFSLSLEEDFDRDFRALNWNWASVIFRSLVDSFALAPRCSVEDEEVEVLDSPGGGAAGGGKGVRRSLMDPRAGSLREPCPREEEPDTEVEEDEGGEGVKGPTPGAMEEEGEAPGSSKEEGGGEEEEEEELVVDCLSLFSFVSLRFSEG